MESTPPLGAPTAPPYPHNPTQTALQWPIQTRTNDYALTSMILGIVSVILAGAITGIPAIILGHKAKRQLAFNQHESGSGMATAGIVLGWIGVAFTILIVLCFIAMVILAALTPSVITHWGEFTDVSVS